MIFTKAGPAEILRAAQKDDLIIQKLQQMIIDCLLRFGGTRIAISHKLFVDCLGHILYYLNTTVSELQTLGEEYTGILQVNSSSRTMPHLLARLLMVVLDCFGTVAVLKLLTLLGKTLDGNENLRPEAKAQLHELMNVLKALVPFICHLHKAWFYLSWGTYSIAKRITGIHYILVRSWLKDRESLFGFKMLGIFTLIHLTVYSLISFYGWLNQQDILPKENCGELQELSANVGTKKCALCLDFIKNVSTTPCGHLFCWTCILVWLQSQSKCPLCREFVVPSRIVALQNYQ